MELYQPRDIATRDALGRLFLEAEEVYMGHLPDDECGTISLEPLVGNRAGPPAYLRDRLQPEQRAAYAIQIERLNGEFEKLQLGLQSNVRAGRVLDCLRTVRRELADLK